MIFEFSVSSRFFFVDSVSSSMKIDGKSFCIFLLKMSPCIMIVVYPRVVH